MQSPIEIEHSYSAIPYVILNKLNSLPDTVACDFEAALRYRPDELEAWKLQLEEDKELSQADRIAINARLKATALSHPFHVVLTHFSIAWSDHEAFVAILETKKARDVVLQWLVTTDRLQIWHNASFDFKHIYYHTRKFPLRFEDTQLLAKTLVNHVDVWRAKVGLKELAEHVYGGWGVSSELFTLANLRDKVLLKYAGVDACATFWLYEAIKKKLAKEKQDDHKKT